MILSLYDRYREFVLSEDGPLAGLLLVCFLLGLLIIVQEQRR